MDKSKGLSTYLGDNNIHKRKAYFTNSIYFFSALIHKSLDKESFRV